MSHAHTQIKVALETSRSRGNGEESQVQRRSASPDTEGQYLGDRLTFPLEVLREKVSFDIWLSLKLVAALLDNVFVL